MRGVLVSIMLLAVACDDGGDILIPDDAGVVIDAGVEDAGVVKPVVPDTDDDGELLYTPAYEPPCTVEPALVPFECQDDADFCDPVDMPDAFYDLAAMWSRRENDTWIIEIRLHGRWFVFPPTQYERDSFYILQWVRLYWLDGENNVFTNQCFAEDIQDYGTDGVAGVVDVNLFFRNAFVPPVEPVGIGCSVSYDISRPLGVGDRCGFIGNEGGLNSASDACIPRPAVFGGCDDLWSISEDLTTIRYVDAFHYIPVRPFGFVVRAIGSANDLDDIDSGCVDPHQIELADSRGGSSGLTFFPLSQYRALCRSQQQ
jgi:hypothetical protein